MAEPGAETPMGIGGGRHAYPRERPDRRRHRVRTFLIILIALVAAVLVWLGLCWRFVVHPRVDQPQPVDALYVIGPAEERMPLAIDLARSGLTATILTTVSVDPRTGERYPRDYCAGYPGLPDIIIECVDPDPYTTRGEARLLNRVAAERGWDHVAVLTTTAHVARARMWMNRCVDGPTVEVWEFRQPHSVGQWLFSFAYQSGAWLKSRFQPGC